MLDRHWKGKQAAREAGAIQSLQGGAAYPWVKAPASIWPTFSGIGMGSAGKPVEDFAASPRRRDDAVTFGAGSLSSRRNELSGALQSGVPILFRLRE